MREVELPYCCFGQGGMLLVSDRSALVHLCQGAMRVLEIGINSGQTARLLLDNCSSIRSYVGIDVPPDFVTELTVQQQEVPALAGQAVKDDPRVRIILKPTQQVRPDEIGDCDFAFIDADHSIAGIERDTALARACVERGIIAWHDYRVAEPPTHVNEVLDRWEADGAPIVHVNNTWIAFERVGL